MPQPSILCDIGNVLVTFDFSIAAERLAMRSAQPKTAVLQLLHPLKELLEEGDLEDSDFISQAIAAIDFQGDPAEFHSIWCEIFAPNPAIVPTLQSLANSTPLFLLSNTSGLHKDHLFASYPVFQLFADGVYSYSAKCSKPSPEIFRHTLERLDLDPAQTFFIDDLAANIATAADMGFATHLYDHLQHHRLETALESWRTDHPVTPVVH